MKICMSESKLNACPDIVLGINDHSYSAVCINSGILSFVGTLDHHSSVNLVKAARLCAKFFFDICGFGASTNARAFLLETLMNSLHVL